MKGVEKCQLGSSLASFSPEGRSREPPNHETTTPQLKQLEGVQALGVEGLPR